MTVVNLCRVTVCRHDRSTAAGVDLAVPAWMEIAEILPRVVALAGVADIDLTERWMLSRVDGSPLDESLSLADNGIGDGDILVLSAEPIAVPHLNDMSHYVAEASREDDVGRRLGPLAGVWSLGTGAAVLAFPGPTAPGIRAVVAAVAALSTAVAAAVYDRIGADSLPTLSLGTGAVALGAVAGYLMVPGGPAPPNFFLGATVCTALSTMLLHLTSRGTTLFVAIAALSAIVAIAAAAVTVWPAPTASLGAALAAGSLAMLGAAARLSVILTGLAPRMPDTGGAPGTEMVAPAVGAARAVRGHHTATGLMAGFSISTALGTVLVASGHGRWSGVALTAAVSVALLFRAAQQRGAIRTAVIFSAGMISATASLTLAGLLAPQQSVWLSVVVIVAGLGGLWATLTEVGSRLSPFARRGLEVVDYLALAAVVPLACWVIGVFGFVRGLSLT